jgi:RimJ/RimL family protein N-acetyltransferase
MTELTDVSGAFGYGDSILVGERVRLRGVRDDDLPALAIWEMDPGRLITLSNWAAPPSEGAAKERIRKRSANESDDLGFAIETLGDPPALVGRIWLSTAGACPKDRRAAVGIALGREYTGRGYGTDAMRVIVSYGFRELGLHRIQLGVALFNIAGIRAYQKAGFVEEGRYRESVLHDGRWYDEVLMSILDHEWAARRSPGRLHRENRYDRMTTTVEEITGRPAESVEEFVARRSDLFA